MIKNSRSLYVICISAGIYKSLLRNRTTFRGFMENEMIFEKIKGNARKREKIRKTKKILFI